VDHQRNANRKQHTRMRKIILGLVAATAVAAPIALVASSASAAPGVTTHNITVNAADEVVYDLPALNSQFTKMTLTASGTANWGADFHTDYTANGDYAGTNRDLVSGVWNNNGVDDWGLLAENIQVGKVVYRIDGGEWTALDKAETIDPAGNGTHTVQVAYNERPGIGSHTDNSGSLNLNVVRTS
jgi:hypothetical protein